MDNNVKKLIQTSLFLAIAIIFQIIGRNIPQINQFLVGPMINCILLVTTFVCGKWWGISVGILSPLLALAVGQLAAPLALFIPFIMMGNFIYVFLFSLFIKKQLLKRFIGIVLGSIAKYAFLTLAATKIIYILGIDFPSKILKVLTISMGIPQLITALVGGIFALIIIQLLIKRKVI